MKERINDKIKEIEESLAELEEIIPDSFEAYNDNKTKAACERYFERIVEAAVDLAFIIVRERSLKLPEEEKEVFDSLVKAKIITSEVAARLRNAKGMRNVIAHQYGQIDDELVFESLKNELVNDIKDCIKQIKRLK